MGVVYRAYDEKLERTVAVKALPAELASDPARLERFRREARVLAQLTHPNIAGIHDIKEHEGATYLILEFIEGDSLASRLEHGPLQAEEAVEFAVQIAAGVEAAHEADVIHRDLKPANVMVTPDGQLKVLDFGLARSDGDRSTTIQSEAATLTSPAMHSPTMPGMILGTAAYMSPEQARGRRVDKRTDIWSFGVLLYEMLTGASPFVGDTVSDSIGAVLHKSVDLERLPPATPASIRRVLNRCLERDKALRYRDIGDVRLDLLSTGGEEQETKPTGKRAGGLLALSTAAVVALSGALAYSILDREAPQAMPIHASVLTPEGLGLGGMALSPDARRLVMIGDIFSTASQEISFRDQVFVRSLDEQHPRKIEGLIDVFHAAFSPDGRWLVVATGIPEDTGVQLYRLPADVSGPPTKLRRISEKGRVAGRAWFAWTPQSEIAFFDATTRELVVIDAGTGEDVRRVEISGGDLDSLFSEFGGPFGDRWISINDPTFSDDGYREDVILVDTITGEASRSIRDANNARLLSDGRVLFSRGPMIMQSGFSFDTMRSTGEIQPVFEGPATYAAWEYGSFEISQTGALAYPPGGLRGQKRQIVRVDADGNETPWSVDIRPFEGQLNATQDGSRVAVVVSGQTGVFEVWVAENSRGQFRRLLAEPGKDITRPTIMPDGESVLMVVDISQSSGGSRIVSMPFDGSSPPRVIYQDEQYTSVSPQDVSEDGRWVLTTVRREDGERRTIEIPTDPDSGLQPRELYGLHPTADSLQYAPNDLPLLTYVSEEDGRWRLFVREIRDGKLGTPVPIEAPGVIAVSWFKEADGSFGLYYLRDDRSVWMTPLFYDEEISIGQSRQVRHEIETYLDGEVTQGLEFIGVKRGPDEVPITHINLVTNWLSTLDE